jgi:autotransporter strand-loop-strand O-heptosyltransferase
MFEVAERVPDRLGGDTAGDYEPQATAAPGKAVSALSLEAGTGETASASASPARIATYPAAASVPTQAGPEGIRFDFNEGCRLLLPARETGVWRARIRDLDSGNILFEAETKGGLVRSAKRWFVRFGIEVDAMEEGAKEARPVFAHAFDLVDRDVVIQIPVGTLGDAIAWFSFACRFGAAHPGVRVACAMSPLIIALFQDAYPEIRFVAFDDFTLQKLNQEVYATYYLGLFFNDAACEWQPTDFRHVGLHRTAAHILGLDPAESPPRMRLPDESRPIVERYVLVGAQATSAAKMWNNPNGWREIVAQLKRRGYRVICIDQKPVHGQGIFWNHIPYGSEDMTGDVPLVERARWLRHADLFVGLASGLSWLAWAAGCPIVLISGFSQPNTEFSTPYRVINWHTCNGCWNDVRHTFDHKDFLWCPRHANTPRQFECTRLITSTHVMQTIDMALPAPRAAAPA